MTYCRLLSALGLCFLLNGCGVIHQDEVRSRVYTTAREQDVQSLPAPFTPIASEDLVEPWARELYVARRFARDLDLYRAITCFRRALYLLPDDLEETRQEAEYGIFLSYYLGRKPHDAIQAFENSHLSQVVPSFSPYDDLLIALEDTYRQVEECSTADKMHGILASRHPDLAAELELGHAVADFRVGDLVCVSPERLKERTCRFVNDYCQCVKSPCTAKTLQAILPGAGYFYVGQTRAALTSLIINTVFIAATYKFFDDGNFGAGIIAGSLEIGWYFGGINGAGLAAQDYNERLYRRQACDFMRENHLFPLMKLRHSF